MADAIPLKIIDGAAAGEKKLAELVAGDVIPATHLPPLTDPDAVTTVEFTAHTGDQTNPHAVTAAQVGAAASAELTTHTANAAIHRILDDTQTDAASLWSAAKILLEIQAKINALVGAAPGTLDQLNEIAAALADDPNFAATMTTQLALKADKTNLDAHTSATDNPHTVTAAHVGVPAGVDTQLQFNDASTLGAAAGLFYDKTEQRLTVPHLHMTKPVSFTGATADTLTVEEVHDYAHANLPDTNVLVLDSALSSAHLTGMTGGWGGRVLAIVNASSTTPLHLQQESAESLPENRFYFDISIQPTMGCMIFYNSAMQRWGILSETSLFGRFYHYAESLSVSTTTNESWQDKVSLILPDMPQGLYRICISYGWNMNTTQYNFQARLLLDGQQFGELHYQEPQDSSGSWGNTGSDQRHYVMRTYRYMFTPGAHEFKLQYSTQDDEYQASIWDASLEVWRVHEHI